MERTYHVYFMASQSGVLYLGVTSSLAHCVTQHKQKSLPRLHPEIQRHQTSLVRAAPHRPRSHLPRKRNQKVAPL
jgi:predicted GIY-YIG superfamily endonuclease